MELRAALFRGRALPVSPSCAAGSPEALQTFLTTKLDALAPSDKAQARPLLTACCSTFGLLQCLRAERALPAALPVG